MLIKTSKTWFPIYFLQESVASSLLEKLAEINMSTELTSTSMKITDINLVHLVVGQLKWLDDIVGSKVV